MTRWVSAAAVVGAAVALGGCLEDENVYSSGGDAKVKRVAQGVVMRNLTALERGDGRTFCSTYTPQFLSTYHDGYARCISKFKQPDPHAPPPRIRFTDFLTATDEKVAVAFKPAGRTNEQTYYLRFTAPPPQVGSAKRWLIDLEAVEQE